MVPGSTSDAADLMFRPRLRATTHIHTHTMIASVSVNDATRIDLSKDSRSGNDVITFPSYTILL